MNFVVTLYAALLFFILTPNVLLRIPRKGSVMTVAAVHAVVFGLLLFFSSRFVSQLLMMNTMPYKEGAGEACKVSSDCMGGEICEADFCVAAK